jgi:hypothetical protein
LSTVNDPLSAYSRSGKNSVSGWLARSDAELFQALLTVQVQRNIVGAVAEIGVHHGKSFIPMAISNGGQKCYAIDIFGRQDLNIDASGSGDKQQLFDNLKRFGVATNGITIDERLSTVVQPGDIEARVGKVRFFHIDGGHHLEAIVNDLYLAEAVMLPEGIIAVDDVFRPEWPEVSMGLFSYLAGKKRDFIPFAVGFNKTYLCERAFAESYRSHLLGNDFLSMYLTKRYKVSQDEILVFQSYPLPEWGLKNRAMNYLKVFHPGLAYSLVKFRRRLRA